MAYADLNRPKQKKDAKSILVQEVQGLQALGFLLQELKIQ